MRSALSWSLFPKVSRGVGEATHAIHFQLSAMALANVEGKSRAGKKQDRQRYHRDPERKPARRRISTGSVWSAGTKS